MWRILANEVFELLPAASPWCLYLVQPLHCPTCRARDFLTPLISKAYSSMRAFELLLRAFSRGAIFWLIQKYILRNFCGGIGQVKKRAASIAVVDREDVQ
jgi:hypothetical protein